MHPVWKQESELARFLERQLILRSITSPVSTGYHRFQEEDLVHLDQTITALESVQSRVSHNQEHYNRIGDLLVFLRQFRKDLPMQTAEQIFERVQPLIKWLFWLPPAMLRGGDADISGLAILAQFFGVGVALDSLFPDMGGAYLGALSLDPAEDIFRIIMARNSADPFNAELQFALSLLDFPRHIVARYRNCLHWSPRPSIDHCHSAPPSPYRNLHDFNRIASSSPSSASPPYAAYASPIQSPPAVTMTSSPFEVTGVYATAPVSHTAYYPPSPHLLSNIREERAGLTEFSQPGALSHSPAFSPTYVEDMMCGGTHRTDGPLGLNVGLYNESHPFNAGGLVTPGLCWTWAWKLKPIALRTVSFSF